MSVVFGIHAVQSVLARQPQGVSRLLLQQGRDDSRLTSVVAQAAEHGIPVVRLPRRELDELAGGRHQGVIAELVRQAGGSAAPRLDEKQLLSMAAERGNRFLVLVLDGITDPHNLGACLRTADAAGVDAVVVPKDKSADLNATVRKVACGAAETVPFLKVTNMARFLRQLQEAGVWLYGAAGEAEKSIYDMEFSGPVALLMGSEGSGLRRLTREHCDYLVHLPMAGTVSSLNVSVATGICLYEIQRSRGVYRH